MSPRDSGLVWNCILIRFIEQAVERDRYVYEVLLVDINWGINNINAGKLFLTQLKQGEGEAGGVELLTEMKEEGL